VEKDDYYSEESVNGARIMPSWRSSGGFKHHRQRQSKEKVMDGAKLVAFLEVSDLN